MGLATPYKDSWSFTTLSRHDDDRFLAEPSFATSKEQAFIDWNMSKPETNVVWDVNLAHGATENLSVGTQSPIGIHEADEKVTTLAGATYGTLVVFGDRAYDDRNSVNDARRRRVFDWAKQYLRSRGFYPVLVKGAARSFISVFGVHEGTVTETRK